MPGYEMIGDEELDEVQTLFRESGILFRRGFDDQRNGIYRVDEFEDAFAERMEVPHALAVTSGTAALRVALAGLGIGRGDEVITQSFTFVATVEAIVEAGATPVCTEVDDTLNMDPDDLENRIGEDTAAIIVVHMLGVPARLDRILEIASRHDVPVIEDTAWGCGGSYRGRPLGTHGAVGTFSFDFAKTMTTGEGGMVVTSDGDIADRARAWHDHGHENNPDVPRWEDTRSGSGFNFRMTEMQGAVGLAQLEKLDDVVRAQRSNRRRLRSALDGLGGLRFRTVPEGGEETADALVFEVEDAETARRCREELVDRGVGTKILPEAITWHYAGTWDHIPSLVASHGDDLGTAFPRSDERLGRCVAVPVSVRSPDDLAERCRSAVKAALG